MHVFIDLSTHPLHCHLHNALLSPICGYCYNCSVGSQESQIIKLYCQNRLSSTSYITEGKNEAERERTFSREIQVGEVAGT